MIEGPAVNKSQLINLIFFSNIPQNLGATFCEEGGISWRAVDYGGSALPKPQKQQNLYRYSGCTDL